MAARRGATRWARALGAKPVLLLLLTPQVFTAKDHAGALRIDDPNDPVRREFSAALEAEARVIPLCCDGVDAPPADLPPPFDRIGDYTWRRLRAYDWRNDFQRLVDDLAGARAARPPGRDRAARRHDAGRRGRREPRCDGGAIVLGRSRSAIAAALGWKAMLKPPRSSRRDHAVGHARHAGSRPSAADPPFALTLQLKSEGRIELVSTPVPVDDRAGWATLSRILAAPDRHRR